MAYAASEARLPAAPAFSAILAGVAAPALATAHYLRRRWIYQRTLTDLQGYTERNLLDMGADRGVEEFARRAAGL